MQLIWEVTDINRIHHWCSVGTGKFHPEGPPFQWETKLAKFATERGLGFFWNHWTVMIDYISHIPILHFATYCKIFCWWRHWGWCLQSMNQLETRINSTLRLFHQNGFTRTRFPATVTWVSKCVSFLHRQDFWSMCIQSFIAQHANYVNRNALSMFKALNKCFK